MASLSVVYWSITLKYFSGALCSPQISFSILFLVSWWILRCVASEEDQAIVRNTEDLCRWEKMILWENIFWPRKCWHIQEYYWQLVPDTVSICITSYSTNQSNTVQLWHVGTAVKGTWFKMFCQRNFLPCECGQSVVKVQDVDVWTGHLPVHGSWWSPQHIHSRHVPIRPSIPTTNWKENSKIEQAYKAQRINVNWIPEDSLLTFAVWWPDKCQLVAHQRRGRGAPLDILVGKKSKCACFGPHSLHLYCGWSLGANQLYNWQIGSEGSIETRAWGQSCEMS